MNWNSGDSARETKAYVGSTRPLRAVGRSRENQHSCPDFDQAAADSPHAIWNDKLQIAPHVLAGPFDDSSAAKTVTITSERAEVDMMR